MQTSKSANLRNLVKDEGKVISQADQHKICGKPKRYENQNKFWNKTERHLVNRGSCLNNPNQQTYSQCYTQNRTSYNNDLPQRHAEEFNIHIEIKHQPIFLLEFCTGQAV